MLLWSLFLSVALAGLPNVSVGQHALTFSLPAINEDVAVAAVGNSRVSLSDFVGVTPQSPREVVVLFFFDRRALSAGSAAGGGTEELAAINRLQKRFGDQGVQFLAISNDTGAIGGLATWLEEQKLGFPVLRDNHRVVSGRYGIDDLPFTLIIDKNGYIFAMGRPTAAEFETAVTAELEPLLNPPPASAGP